MKRKKVSGTRAVVTSGKDHHPENELKAKDRQRNYLSGILLFFCFILYANTGFNDYCLDDTMLITENSSTQKGFSGIGEHITQDMLYGFKHVKSRTAASSGWRPLSMITYSIEVGLWGKNKPGLSHFINMLLYACVVLLLFLFLNKFLIREVWVSFFTALLFALHPIHTEVTANIKSRDELLCLFFLLLSLLQFWKFLQEKRNRSLVLALSYYFISLTAKENSITFILGIPVMIYFFTDTPVKKIITYAFYFFFTAVVYLLVRNAFVPFTGLAPNPEIINNSYLQATGLQALSTKLFVMLFALKMLVYPYPLSYDYSFNQIPYKDTGDPFVWISTILYLALLIYALAGFRRKNIFSFCILMFFITYSISSNLFVEIGVIFAERLLFIPSIFFCLALAVGGKRLVLFIDRKTRIKRNISTVILIVPVILAGSYLTIARNAEWKNERTLVLADIAKSPNSARANSGAGGAYLFYSFEEGISRSRKDSLLRESEKYLKKSLQIYPEFNDAWLNLGVAYSQMGDIDRAEECWNIVRKSNPNHPKFTYFDNFLANKYMNDGLRYARENRVDSALVYLDKALGYSSRNDSIKITCLYNLGGMYFSAGNYEKAYEMLGRVVEINPNYENARAGLAESDRLRKLGK